MHVSGSSTGEAQSLDCVVDRSSILLIDRPDSESTQVLRSNGKFFAARRGVNALNVQAQQILVAVQL